MIDVHCHYDLFSSPEQYIYQAEREGDIVIGMTNLPSHFELGIGYTHALSHIRLALGFHPLLTQDNQNELILFEKNLSKTSYIGEIGLDFSKQGYEFKQIQIDILRKILSYLKGEKKIISVHSRKAEKELLELLKEFRIENVIFHWYTGPISLIKEIERLGYYFSVNPSMMNSNNGRKILASISKDRILTETDAPFNSDTDVIPLLNFIGISQKQVHENLRCVLSGLK